MRVKKKGKKRIARKICCHSIRKVWWKAYLQATTKQWVKCVHMLFICDGKYFRCGKVPNDDFVDASIIFNSNNLQNKRWLYSLYTVYASSKSTNTNPFSKSKLFNFPIEFECGRAGAEADIYTSIKMVFVWNAHAPENDKPKKPEPYRKS